MNCEGHIQTIAGAGVPVGFHVMAESCHWQRLPGEYSKGCPWHSPSVPDAKGITVQQGESRVVGGTKQIITQLNHKKKEGK